MKKILIAIIVLFVAMSSCTKEYSREISKSEKFHLAYLYHGSTAFANGETSFSVRAVNSNSSEQLYIAEFICTSGSKYYCREYGSFEEVKENMLNDLRIIDNRKPDFDIYGTKYVWLFGDRDVNGEYVFNEYTYGHFVMVCPSVSEYIECLQKLN